MVDVVALVEQGEVEVRRESAGDAVAEIEARRAVASCSTVNGTNVTAAPVS